MCGIAGILSTDPAGITHERLLTMTDALAHRGPDGEGHWIDTADGVGLGHRRLSILDLSAAGKQPMPYLGRYIVIHNGEIYNHEELRSSLVSRGYSFASRTDTELIPAAYDLYGTGCIAEFDGMFAFALWDRLEKTLFLARDRFGEKPLFLYQDDTQLLFASEMKALWAAGVAKESNPTMVFNYLTLGYTHNPGDPAETFYKNITRLPARSYFRYHISSGKKEIVQYWDPPSPVSPSATAYRGSGNDGNPGAGRDAAVTEEFNSLVTTSIRRRLRSDVAIGASLSGGLDSSSIVAYVGQAAGAPPVLPTFSAVFPGFEKDESAFIHRMASFAGQPNYSTEPTARGLIEVFERLAAHQEEPFQSSSIYAQYRVYGLAAAHGIKVLLDGQGADELLAGYHRYFPWYWRELYRSSRRMLAPELAAARQAGAAEQWTWQHRLAALLPTFAAGVQKRRRMARQRADRDLARDFVRSAGVSYYHLPPVTRLSDVLRYNSLTNGLEELLRYADRNSMAHGVEIRLPFLDHRLAEFLFALPARYKIRDGWTKWLLRTCAAGILPPEIAWRKDKIGYEPPQAGWMADKTIQEYIMEARRGLVTKGILDRSVMQKKIQPTGAHAAENNDWRYLVTAACLG